jgi:sodium/proline symporter
MGAYVALSIGVGLWYSKRSSRNAEAYFLGSRGLGPWAAPMSAEASDMSGWLLMGLPGVAYFAGAGEAAWTAIGLAIGTWTCWKVVARRLRSYSIIAGGSITLPAFCLSAAVICVVSRAMPEPSAAIREEFDEARVSRA